MRKEISSLFKFKTKKTKKNIFWILVLMVLFITVNGLFIYIFNFSGFYFYAVKKIIPYPALIVGNKIVTFSYYDEKLSESKKIYEIAYRVNFNSGTDSKKNLDVLKENVKNEIIDRITMEGLLKSEEVSITTADTNKEYNNMLKNIGSDKEILNILKYSSGIKDSDIKDQIYQGLLKEKVKNDFVYNLKMKVIVIKPDDSTKEEDWNKAAQKSQEIYNDIISGNSSFDKYQVLYGDKNDPIVQNFGRDYYFGEDLPEGLRDNFYALKLNKVNEPIKGEGGYYIFNVLEKKGYYHGSYSDFMKEQTSKIRIVSFMSKP